MKTQNVTINLAPGQSIVNNLRAAMQRKSETFSRLLGCPMTAGQGVGMVLSSLPVSAALVLASFGQWGWAATCALLAANLAAGGLMQLWKEGGER